MYDFFKMDKSFILDIFILIILIIGYIYIEDTYYFFQLIYAFLILYQIYISICVFKFYFPNNKPKIIIFVITSLFIYPFSYFIIFDTNPFFFIFVYYLFFPYFWKSIFIVFIHSYILSKFAIKENIYKQIENNSDFGENISLKGNISNSSKTTNDNSFKNYYFLFGIFSFIKRTKKRFFVFLISLILIIILDIVLFINRIKLWVFFNNKSKTLPKMTSTNTTFYITATLVNMNNIIKNYIKEMIKLINYLGKENVIVSIVENGDSIDDTAKYLEEFSNLFK